MIDRLYYFQESTWKVFEKAWKEEYNEEILDPKMIIIEDKQSYKAGLADHIRSFEKLNDNHKWRED